MEEVPANSKESPHSAHANGMKELTCCLQVKKKILQ
jgi:hypothetical protein